MAILKLSNLVAGGSGKFRNFRSVPSQIDYVVCAGGGGTYSGGGGAGAGGYRTTVGTSGRNSPAEPALSVNKGTAYSVAVGAGSNTGGTSTFASISSAGGGRGGPPGYNVPAQAGGCGGGGAGNCPGGAGTSAQGFPGSFAGHGARSGGGGAAGSGVVYGGGSGRANAITGSNVTRSRGGHGHSSGTGPLTNVGEGANTGGRVGGSGVVVIRYARDAADPTISAGVTYSTFTDGNYRGLIFTAGSGTATWEGL